MIWITKDQALQYEVRSSWWAKWISNETLADLAAKYFAWKVIRKYRRYSHYQ